MMTAETHPSLKSSSSAGDSYLGRSLSLTSKSEMRYEGILIRVTAADASIALRNVKAYGTEGRKMDGPQVPPSEILFEYIRFRASDIKDLKVKSSPPIIQSTIFVPNDPAIIQSQYTEKPTISTNLPSSGSGNESEQDPCLQTSQVGLPEQTFQGNLVLDQPDVHSESWGPSQLPAPSNNMNELAMPMDGQSVYGAANGFLTPMSLSPSMQQTMHRHPMPASYANVVANSPTPKSHSPSPSPRLSVHIPSWPSCALTTKSPIVASDSVSSLIPKESCIQSPPYTPLDTSLQLESSLTSEWNEAATPSAVSVEPEPTDSRALPHLTVSDIVTSPVNMPTSHWNEGPTQFPMTPGQLLHSRPPAITIPHSSPTAQKDVEVVQIQTPQSTPRSAPSLEPAETKMRKKVLPLAPQSEQKMMCPVARYGEDIDIVGMDQKFNKDDGWGDLSKNDNGLGDRGNNGKNWGSGENNDNGRKDRQNNDNSWGDLGQNDRGLQKGARADQDASKDEFKPAYVKNDFFDSLSSVPADYGSHNGRTRFYDQMRKDSETFGYFPRHHRGGYGGQEGHGVQGGRGGRGVWGPAYHGRSRDLMISTPKSNSMSGCGIRYQNKQCFCHIRAEIRVTENGQNLGKLNYACKLDTCRFWQWCDPVTNVGLETMHYGNGRETQSTMEVKKLMKDNSDLVTQNKDLEMEQTKCCLKSIELKSELGYAKTRVHEVENLNNMLKSGVFATFILCMIVLILVINVMSK